MDKYDEFLDELRQSYMEAADKLQALSTLGIDVSILIDEGGYLTHGITITDINQINEDVLTSTSFRMGRTAFDSGDVENMLIAVADDEIVFSIGRFQQ